MKAFTVEFDGFTPRVERGVTPKEIEVCGNKERAIVLGGRLAPQRYFPVVSDVDVVIGCRIWSTARFKDAIYAFPHDDDSVCYTERDEDGNVVERYPIPFLVVVKAVGALPRFRTEPVGALVMRRGLLAHATGSAEEVVAVVSPGQALRLRGEESWIVAHDGVGERPIALPESAISDGVADDPTRPNTTGGE